MCYESVVNAKQQIRDACMELSSNTVSFFGYPIPGRCGSVVQVDALVGHQVVVCKRFDLLHQKHLHMSKDRMKETISSVLFCGT